MDKDTEQYEEGPGNGGCGWVGGGGGGGMCVYLDSIWKQ